MNCFLEGEKVREKIIDLLRKNINKHISGQEISRQMSISRTAVWKHIQQLKQSGYDIEAVYKKGYILNSIPDLLLPAEIRANLQTKWLGQEIVYQKDVQSTNTIAKQKAFDGCKHGTIIVSEQQLAGKGRLSRGWFSPTAQGIWFSVVLRPPLLPQEAPKFTLLVALALARVFEQQLELKVGIKWPNDIIYKGKKIVGILTEMNAAMEGINYIVIGIGINVNIKKSILPDDIKDKAASLSDFTDEPIDRSKLLCDILKEFEFLYDKVIAEGFDFVLKQWRDYCITIGKNVKVIAPGESFQALAVDIDDNGALIVQKEDKSRCTVLAGDVSIRAQDGKSYI